MKHLIVVLIGLALLGPPRQMWGDSPVVISEFMAINNTTLADEDGDFSDWIELFNPTTNTVNLGGWYLTGNAANPTKWQFPATNLGPSDFLVVFASNKNRRLTGAPLHTNFKLGGSGEYLALVMPDGVTKATEFAPTFPPQYADLSYGFAMTGAVTTLIAPNASVRARVPAADLGTSWKSAGFDDSTWSLGTLGVGYDTSGSYASALGLNLQTAMLNSNATAYLRVPFTVADPAGFNFLTLSLRYDDGFVAYLNGTEVLRRNAPASPVWNSAATAGHGPPAAGVLLEDFEGGATNYTLSQYGSGSLPAVQPAGANSTGKYLRLLYDGVNGAANAVTFRQTAPGLFESIVAEFDFRISNAANYPADGFSFLLIPTVTYGTNGAGLNTSSQSAEEPNYPGVFAMGFDVYPHGSQNDVSVHWNGVEATNATIPLATMDLAAGVFHHVKLTLQYVAGGARATVALTPNSHGVPGATITPITNFFMNGVVPYDCRVELGGRTGGLNLGLDLDNMNVQFRPPQGVLAFEDFDLTAFRGQLAAGANLLAIQGLNISRSNANFLIQPQLVGRKLGLAGAATFLYPPTPGTWNNSLGISTLPAPVTFFPPAGVYPSNSLPVTLASASSSATIHYTLDGSLPTTNSPVYSNALVLTVNRTIRAVADSGGVAGPVSAANYVLLDSTVTNFSSNLPLVIIDTLGQGIPDGSKVPVYGIFVDTNAVGGRTYLVSSNNYSGALAIGLHGSSSLGFPKKTFAIELDDQNGKDLSVPLLGLPAGSDWLLYPSYDDKTLLNNVLTEQLFAAMGHYAVRCKYMELFLRGSAGKLSAADYQGIYVLIERIKLDPNRLDLTKLQASDNAPPQVTGGYIFSKDKINPGDLTFNTPSGQQLIVVEPKASDVTPAQFNYLSNDVAAFETALYGGNWRDPVAGYTNYIGVDSFVDYHWIVEFPKNIDGIRISNYLHKDREGRIKEGPIWDWDLSWGNANYLEGGKTNGWYYQQLGAGDDLWLSRLRTDPDFYQRIIDRWGELRSGLFHPTNILARVDQVTNLLAEAQAREFAAWPRLGSYVWPNPDGVADGWDVDYVNPTSYAEIIGQFKKFIQGRYQWIDQQFLPAPVVQTNGNQLTLSAPIGAIYYTLDGTDPRAPGGGLSPSSRWYGGAVTMTNNSAVFARAIYTNTWSPPARALYVATLPAFRITEINYHPTAPPSNSPYADKDFEFVEIQNTGSNALNLGGLRLGGGIDYTFPSFQLMPTGAATSNDFGGGGTPYTAMTLSQPPAPAVTNDGPAGNLLNLLKSGAAPGRNRVAFDRTAPGPYGRELVEFDFRASTAVPTNIAAVATHQDFDAAGTGYVLSQAGPTAPGVQAADSGSAGSFLRLTPPSGGERGEIAFNRTTTGAVSTVVATFDFRITPAGGGHADGLAFALLNTTTYGVSGAAPDFTEEPNLASAIGIGFDDYNNGGTPAEPNNNHISIHWNGAQVGDAFTPSFDMSNGKFNRARITVQFSGGNAYVSVQVTPDINGTPGSSELVAQNVLLSGVTPFESRVAFSARTGGAYAAHDIDNVDVIYGANAAAAGLSLELLPVARFGAAGAGSGLADFTDAPLFTNGVALDFTYNPSNVVNDVGLYWNRTRLAGATIPAATLDLDAGVFHHVRFQLDTANGGATATVTLYPNSLGATGTAVNVFSNYYLPGVVLGETRLEFAARNGGLTNRVDLDNVLASCAAALPLILQPGEAVVVVANQAAFVSRYGGAIRVAGEFSGALDNSGDHLTLTGPVGEPILDFHYDPAWYPVTDGGGYSLVAVNPGAAPANWDLPANWRPSGVAGGSPGAGDIVPPVPLSIRADAPAGVLTLSWPPNIIGLKLYVADSLTPPVSWQLVTNVPVLLSNEQGIVLSPPAVGRAYYRLQSGANP